MAILFDRATSDRIVIPNATDYQLNGDMVIMAWARSSGLGAGQWHGLVVKGDNAWRLHRNSNTAPERLNFASTGVSPLSLSNNNIDIVDGNWHMCMGVIDGSTRHAIVDDNVASGGISGSTANGSWPVWISGNAQQGGREWTGEIVLAAIYDRTMSVNEALAVHAQAAGCPAYGRKSYWPMIEGYPGQVVSGTTVKDVGALQNDSSAVNGTPEWAEQQMGFRKRRAA